ncbi:hypothetical protein evm_010252 [Chilo suppressalis]|nr:hypothetical protein evm_010252 [Chilo suppressalis]
MGTLASRTRDLDHILLRTHRVCDLSHRGCHRRKNSWPWLSQDSYSGGLATVHTYCNDLARTRTAGGDENDASAIHDGWRYVTRSP